MDVRILGAIFAYVFMILGVQFLSWELVKKGGNKLFTGFIMGLVMYGVFDATNYAIFKKYSLRNSVVDVVWGVFLNISVLYFLEYVFL